MKSLAVMLVLALFTLEECIQYAVQSNPEMASARIEAEKSRAMLNSSRLEYLPSLNLYLNQYFNWGRSVDMQELLIIRNRLTKQSGASVGTSFTIFDGMRRVNGTARGKELLQSAVWAGRALEMEITEEVTRAYLECLLARELKESLEEIHSRTLEKAGVVEALCESGMATRSTILEIRAQAASEEADIVQAAGDEQNAKQRLAALMGYEAGGPPFEIEGIDTDCLADKAPVTVELIPEHSPGIIALEHEISACEYGVKEAKGLLLPSVVLTGAYGTYYSDLSPDIFRNQIRDNGNPSLTVSVSLPLFAGGAAAREISTAGSTLKEARARLRKTLLDMENTLDAAGRECEALRRRAAACLEYRRMCREKEAVAEEEFAEGAISASEYIDARKEMIQSDREYICSLYRYLFQQKTIEHYNSYGK